MAKLDHTARACLSEPFWLVNEPQLPLSPALARGHTCLMRVAGASLAMSVIRHLLKNRTIVDPEMLADPPCHAGPWLFTTTQVQGLRAALHFLRRYSDGLLRAEQDG